MRTYLGLLALALLLAVRGTPAAAGPEDLRLILEEPLEGRVVPGRFVVRGRVEGAGPEQAVLRVNGQDVTLDGTRFEVPLSVAKDGPFKIRAVRAVVGLPAVTAERMVEVDVTPPSLEIYSPAQEQSSHAGSEVVIEGVAADAHLRAVRMNGQEITLKPGGLFGETFLLPATGQVRVEIEALDTVGLVTRAVRVLYRAGSLPAAPPAPGPTPAPAPGTAPNAVGPDTAAPPPDRVVLQLDGAGTATLLDGATRLSVPGLDAASPQAGDALATLRDALQAVSWAPPREARGAAAKPRLLVLEAPATMPWQTAGWVLELQREERIRPSAIVFRSVGALRVEARVAPVTAQTPDPKSEPIQVTAGPPPPEEGSAAYTFVVLGFSTYKLLHGDDANIRRTRDAIRSQIRAELAGELRTAPGSQGRLEIQTPSRVPFSDVALLAKTFGDAGILILRISEDPERPRLGTSTYGVTAPPAAPPPAAFPPAAPLPGEPARPQPPAPGTEAPAPPAVAPADMAALLARPDATRLKALGQTRAADEAIAAALAWLAAHQSDTGAWECLDFGRWCDGAPNTGDRPDGPGRELYDVGVTGLALCAFLGAGHSGQGSSIHARTVRRGLAYLTSVQDPEGCFGPRVTQHYVYNHAFAALAMVEAFGVSGSGAYRAPAQRALDFIAFARNPYFVWRYGVKPGDNDTSVTGCMASVLFTALAINKAAAARGIEPPLQIDAEAFDGITAWLDKMTDPDYGRLGYLTRGGGPARPQDLQERFPGEKSESMTAVGLLCRLHAGADPRKDWLLRRAAALLMEMPPRWEVNLGYIDMYYWFYGTQAAYKVGGDLWRTWEASLNKAVLSSQRTEGAPCGFLGSWDPVDAWGPDGGRVYSTAMCALMLEARARALR